jgi:hypothetical protein
MGTVGAGDVRDPAICGLATRMTVFVLKLPGILPVGITDDAVADYLVPGIEPVLLFEVGMTSS